MLLEYYELRKTIDPSWTFEKTTMILGVSKPNLDLDIRLARACRKVPDIRQCRTREDALAKAKSMGL